MDNDNTAMSIGHGSIISTDSANFAFSVFLQKFPNNDKCFPNNEKCFPNNDKCSGNLTANSTVSG